MNILKEVLFKEGYGSPDELIRDWALIMALSKLEQYKAENDFFEKKYRMNLEELNQAITFTSLYLRMVVVIGALMLKHFQMTTHQILLTTLSLTNT